MRVTIAVIFYEGRASFSLHNNKDSAGSALAEFVEARWRERFGYRADSPISSSSDRLGVFFSRPEDSYVVGNADLSELAAHIEKHDLWENNEGLPYAR